MRAPEPVVRWFWSMPLVYPGDHRPMYPKSAQPASVATAVRPRPARLAW